MLQLLRLSVQQKLLILLEDLLQLLEEHTDPRELRAMLSERLAAAEQQIFGEFEESVKAFDEREERRERDIQRLEAVLREPRVRLRRAGKCC
ncbi:Protein BNI1 [Dissostichus eleginoides]|uniref:Protein BNI1 n=1 Tax=Dissostichus eleginoides TaxID=100907 RepID=A0AAD9B4U6_DISEL|nr:Protein BNI1 [Dissostichus eleginoides]